MGLHLELHVLTGLEQLHAVTTPMAVLTVNEDMDLNRQLTDVNRFNRDQQGVIPVVITRPVLRGFAIEELLHDNQSYKFDVDPYGNELTWLYASEFTAVIPPIYATSTFPVAARTTAALAYIAALPSDTPIVLYWL